MISSFYKKFSLNNLKNAKPRGQIATLLILMIVVILIMILTTVNLGQLSLSSTNLANVADSSALYLASQLASRANQIYISLGGLERCRRAGLGGLFGAIIGAIAGYFLGPVGYMVVSMMIGGAIGGAIGAATAGTSVIQGAFQGAMIGAAIGGGVSQGMTAAASVGEGSAISSANAAMVGSTAATDAAWIEAYMTAYNIALAPYITAGAVAGGGLSASSSLYNAYVANQNLAAAFSAASRMLNGLPEYDRYRESVFLQAFSQTVDDPNKRLDSGDLNANGVVNEKVPNFIYWWNTRTENLKAGIMPNLISIANPFFNTTLRGFADYIDNEIHQGVLSSPGGSIAKVAGVLGPGFWNPQNDGSFDSMVSGFTEFLSTAETYRGIDINQLTSQWQVYIRNFYNADAGAGRRAEDGSIITDYYHTLGEVKGYLADWKRQIIDIRNGLAPCYGIIRDVVTYDAKGNAIHTPTCQDACEGCNECIANQPPCKLGAPYGGTVDSTYNDQITPAINDINSLISRISGFQDAIQQYVRDMENAYSAFESGYGGLNPAVYSWNDSRGEHSVKVEVGRYQVARTITTTSGGSWSKTICIRLVDYSDNGLNSWVQITRRDPQNKDVKSGRVSLGMWNPFFNGIITKKGKASYSYDRVGLTQ